MRKRILRAYIDGEKIAVDVSEAVPNDDLERVVASIIVAAIDRGCDVARILAQTRNITLLGDNN